MPDQPLVTILTVTWNHSYLLRGFLQSLRAALPEESATQTELLVVDNGSQDDTGELLAAWEAEPHGPAFKQVVRCAENLGYGGGNNRGLARARGVHVMLLNNDVLFSGDPVVAALKAQAAAPGTLLGGRLVGNRGRWNRLNGASVPYIEGWCLFAERSLLRSLALRDDEESLQLFDERFSPAFFEDIDLGLRARLMGVRLCQTVLPMRHLGSGTTRHTPSFPYMEILLRNQTRFSAKWAHLDPELLETLAPEANVLVRMLSGGADRLRRMMARRIRSNWAGPRG